MLVQIFAARVAITSITKSLRTDDGPFLAKTPPALAPNGLALLIFRRPHFNTAGSVSAGATSDLMLLPLDQVPLQPCRVAP